MAPGGLQEAERKTKMHQLFTNVPHAGKDQVADWRKRRIEDAGAAPLDKEFIDRVVKWELKHIPRGDKGSLQNSLRSSYKILRRKHLALRKSRHETLKELVEKMRRIHADFIPLFDKEIFKI
jgi:hypothetical protein